MSLILWAIIDSGLSLLLRTVTGGRATLRGSFELDTGGGGGGGCVGPLDLAELGKIMFPQGYGVPFKGSLAACATVDPGSSISPPMWLPHTRGHHEGCLSEVCT